MDLNGRTELTKQALQYIITTYLTRKNNQDISFIHQNIITTSQLVNNINSSVIKGLDRPSLIINQNIYGRNTKRASMGISFFQVLYQQVIKNYQFFMMIAICITSIVFSSIFGNHQLLRDGVWIFIYIIILQLIRTSLWYKSQRELRQFSINRDKNDIYRVIRNGQSIQVGEQKLVVGDIVQLGYKQKIPASGILVSNKQILVNQDMFGRKIQRKMNLEQCLQYIQSMSNLELKLAYQNSQLPSPVLIKGTQVTFGSGRMIILVVDDQQLIKKYRPQCVTLGCKKLDQWCQDMIKKWSSLNRAFTIFLFFLSIFLMIIQKWLIRQTITIQRIFPKTLKCLTGVLAFSILISSRTLMIFFKIIIQRFIISVKHPQQIKKILTASHVILTQQNVVRYDQINIQKIASFQKRDVIDFQQFSTLSTNQKLIINQVINGVLLKSPLQKQQNKNNKKHHHHQNEQNQNNQIKNEYKKQNNQQKQQKKYKSRSDVIQKYKTYQRIVTSFQQCQDIPKYTNNQTLFQLNNKQVIPVVQVSKNEQQLIQVIRNNCKYTTDRILTGLMQIAQKTCKTYYYKKYSSQQFNKIKHVNINGKILQITKQQKQKMKMMARKIVVQNLVPLILGYSQGFDNNCQIDVFVSIIGITKQCNNSSLDLLKRLQDIGIKTFILVPNQPDSKLINVQQLILQYQGKDWLQFRQQQTCQMSFLRKSSGRLVCGNCLIANCDCKNRVEEVSNILQFMKLTNQAKIIYGVTSQTDIYYLQCAFNQIHQTCLNITNHHAQTIQSLNDIIKGFSLFQALEKGITYFLFLGLVLGTIIGLFGTMQDHVFFSRQFLSFLLFFYALPLISFASVTDLKVSHNTKNLNKNRRKLTIITRFSTILIVVLFLLTITFTLMLYFYPNFIPEKLQQSDLKLIQMLKSNPISQNCTLVQIYQQLGQINYIPSAFNVQDCVLSSTPINSIQKPYLLYSRHSTILFNFIFHTIWIFCLTKVISNGDFKLNLKSNLINIIIFILSLIIYLIGLFNSFGGMQVYPNSINFIQYLISVAFSIIVIIGSYLISSILNNVLECLDPQLSSVLDFDQHGQKHYSTVLKKYLSYSDEFILMRKQDQ